MGQYYLPFLSLLQSTPGHFLFIFCILNYWNCVQILNVIFLFSTSFLHRSFLNTKITSQFDGLNQYFTFLGHVQVEPEFFAKKRGGSCRRRRWTSLRRKSSGGLQAGDRQGGPSHGLRSGLQGQKQSKVGQ